ncbi:MAG: SAM-dependent methyltransferase [Rubrivivax sp.]|nr:MAG: SAM-dependent methyltransferase [Rubrivivax sp.]
MRLLGEAHAQHTLLNLVLANPHGGEPQLQRVIARPVVLKGEPQLSFVYRYQTKDITKNQPVAEALRTVRALLGNPFRNAHLHTPIDEVQLAISKKGKATVRVGKAQPSTHHAVVQAQAAAAALAGTAAAPEPVAAAGGAAAMPAAAPPSLSHNREKQRFLDLSRPFLAELGVTDANGQLIPAMSRKWKQINKFIEVFSHALAASPLAEAKQIKVVDFGSGKGYLTFAIHDWLRHVRGVEAQVTGVELRDDLVKLCQKVIARLGLQGMDYEQGDVRHYQPQGLNVMIALHACDVATDYAIHLGVRAGADIIMCSPCCHKQIRPQLLSPHPLRPILQHGIHLGQEAEMLTDGLRALLLDAAGYETQVFEFISLEHTNKNKMILAVKRAQAVDPAPVLAQIREIKAFYGIQEHCLETLLQAA